MRAVAFVGRVGGLAVALGVGAAALTGVAYADTPGPDSSDTSSASTDSRDSQRGTPTTSSGRTGSAVSSVGSATPTSKRAPKLGSGDLGRNIRRFVEKGVAVGTGGALNSGKKASGAPPRKTAEDEPVVGTGTQEPAGPTPSDQTTPVARPRTGSAPSKSSSRVNRNFTQAAPVHESVAAKVTATARAFGATTTSAADAVVSRAADTSISATISATRTPVLAMRSAEPVQKAAATAPMTVTGVLSGVLSALGLSPLAANSPLAPVQPSALMALLAWGTRRESAVALPATTRIGWITGANSLNDTVKRFGIAGTDVGIMWDNGITGDNPATEIVEQRQVLMAFGDTFSGPNMTGIWRNNVLLRSADGVLSDGLFVPNGIVHDPGAYSGSPMSDPNFSREIIGKYGYAVGPEVTIIPTGAISIPGAGKDGATRQYVNFMSVRSWDTPGKWTTNYSGIIYSDDNGQNWTVVPSSSIRAAAPGRATVSYVSGNEKFQQGAFVKPPEGSPEAAEGWVYSYGTPAGRSGTVYVSRVNEYQILDQTKYEYWNGTTWVKNKPAAAAPILPGTTKSCFFGLIKTKTYPTAGEMSVQYNPYLKTYVMLYTDSGNNVVMRTSATPQGTWSAPKTLVTSTQYPGLYAPMIHPWSGTDQLMTPDGTPEDPQYLYWGLSQWNEYNVALMRTDLTKV